MADLKIGNEVVFKGTLFQTFRSSQGNQDRFDIVIDGQHLIVGNLEVVETADAASPPKQETEVQKAARKGFESYKSDVPESK